MMRWMMLVLSFSVVLVWSFANNVVGQAIHKLEIVPGEQRQRLQNGEQEYNKVQSRAGQSKCWEEAVSRLEDGCKDLTDIEQSRLAIAFTNCHLAKSGLETYPCTDVQTIKQCTKDMVKSVLAFNTYTEFYTHTSDICFYLQSKIWQQKTEDTVNRLTSSSQEVADQLEQSLGNQKMVLESQKDSLTNQKQIIKNEAYLKNVLNTSAESAKEAFLDMKKATAQQKAALMETFDGLFKGVDRITKLQSMLLGEFMTLHSLGFYLVSILACYIVTSAPRTAAARLWLFILLSIHILVERFIVRWSVNDRDSQESATTTELLHGRLWTFRKIFVMESILALVYFGTRYCDYAKVNYSMLREIQRELQKLKGKGADLGKCLTDGMSSSFTFEKTKRYPAVHSLENGVDDLTEEEIFTDDSSSSSQESAGSGSESEDPTFMMDDSRHDTTDVQRNLSQLIMDSSRANYNLRPRKCAKDANPSRCRLPSPRTFSDLIFNLTRSTGTFSANRTRNSPRNARRNGDFSSDEED